MNFPPRESYDTCKVLLLRQHGDTRGVVAVEPKPDQLDEGEGNTGKKKKKTTTVAGSAFDEETWEVWDEGGTQSSREAGVWGGDKNAVAGNSRTHKS